MGFFKDFKADLSQAVNDASTDDGMMVNTLDNIPVNEAVNDVAAVIAAKEEREAELQAKAREEKEKAKAERIAKENAEKTVIIDDAEKAVITKSLVIKGDMTTEGSMDIHGVVEGNVLCKGSLLITGKVIGNIKAATVAVSGADVEG
ncbi:MAG: polymer-forming cytoskeletal protein, partial [Lachnospiraceae bacterium]